MTTISQETSSDLLLNEINNILKEYSDDETLGWALACAWTALSYKADHLKILAPKAKSPTCDYIVICTASNPSQAQAIADQICFLSRKTGKLDVKCEGKDYAHWILVDFEGISFHIFLPETRDIYKLEELFNQYPQVKIPEHYYTSTNSVPQIKTDPLNVKDWTGHF